jgi:hypothetical protein
VYNKISESTSLSTRGGFMATQTHTYRSDAKPAGVSVPGIAVQVLLFAVAVAQVVYAVLRTTHRDTSQIATTALLLEIATVPAFLTWFHLARRNAGRWAPQWRGQGWAVGGWFVPVAFLWFPFEIADGVWRASDPATTPRAGKTMFGAHPLLKAWWACWILAWATGFSMKHVTIIGLTGQPTQSVDFSFLPGTTTVSCVLTAAAATLALLVVGRVTRMQNARLVES